MCIASQVQVDDEGKEIEDWPCYLESSSQTLMAIRNMSSVFITWMFFGRKTAVKKIIFFSKKSNRVSKPGKILVTLDIFPEEKSYWGVNSQ